MDCARLFCFGFDGYVAPDPILFALDRDQLGAVILFARNCRDEKQIRSLCTKLREAGGDEIWILVDQEGGRVCRITEPDIGPLPPQDLTLASPVEVEASYRSCGEALRDMGIDFNLAPVADVGLRPDNPVLKDRTLGVDAESVAQRVEAAIGGLTAAGIKSCAKHFPGLGDVNTDPHDQMTGTEATHEDFRDVHFVPFRRAANAGVTAIMTTHVLAQTLDPRQIATFSATIADDILDDQIGFKRLVLTDDLEMKGTLNEPPAAAWRAFEAGHHLMLMCHDHTLQQQALDLFSQRISGDVLAHRRLHRALDRQAPYRKPFSYATV